MKKMKKLTAILLALVLVLGLAACGPTGAENTGSPSQSTPPPNESNPPANSPEVSEPPVTPKDGPIEPDAAGVAAKYSEETTADGWIKVTNQGGATLGYHPDSGKPLIQVDGFAFKDLNGNGKLDVYEDWRNSYEDRARDLASQMSGEEIAPYLTHCGWGTFTTDKSVFTSDNNSGYAYITGGGRGGVTRNMGSTQERNVDHAVWVNLIQELCESLDYGIPGVVSIDPNGQSGLIAENALASTMDPNIALEVGKEYSKQYRAAGVTMLLGPQVDLLTTPVMDRGSGTYGEDPALSRDIAEAFVSGMQSTWDGAADKGWGYDSVVTVMKHYSGAGGGEGGRDDHNDTGRFAVYPNNNYEAHLIPFHDGAFNLSHSSTKAAAGVMMNYSISYSKDGSLGEMVAGAWSQWKYDTLLSNWSGYIISDWGPIEGYMGHWGMEDYTTPERAALAIQLGMTAMGGYVDLEDMLGAWELLADDLGEAEALKIMQDRAYENILLTMKLDLFENPYCSTAHVRETNCTDESRAYGVETQLDSIVMVKNSNNLIKQANGSKKLTVYIPYRFIEAVTGGRFSSPASWTPTVDLEIAAQYCNVVTDTVLAPSGEADNKGNATYTENDIQRASAAEIAACDLVLVGMNSPHAASTVVVNGDESQTWLPPSIQYAPYTAVNAKETSVAGKQIKETFSDGYTQQTRIIEENRSYRGNTSKVPSDSGHLADLQYAKSAASGKPVVVLMSMTHGAMVFSEVEPLADAILVGYKGVGNEAFLRIVAGLHEPNGLLVAQMPASMEAVEAQKGEDLPRDLECYVDADGNVYDFAYGLNWSGKINDQRVRTYSAEPLTRCTTINFKYANQ